MTKPRFGNFIPAGPVATDSDKTETVLPEPTTRATAGEKKLPPTGHSSGPNETPTPVVGTPGTIPAAPSREERRAFSTRIRPSQKAMLDRYVMELKQAGWPVSQEGVLEELLVIFAEDEQLRQRVTARLARV